MTEKITSKTLVPIGAVVGIVGFVGGAIWWASYVTAQVDDIKDIKDKVEKTEQVVNEVKGQISIISQALGINRSVTKQ